MRSPCNATSTAPWPVICVGLVGIFCLTLSASAVLHHPTQVKQYATVMSSPAVGMQKVAGVPVVAHPAFRKATTTVAMRSAQDIVPEAQVLLPSSATLSFASIAACAVGAALAYIGGRWFGEQRGSPAPMAMLAATGESGPRPEWDNRVSLLEQQSLSEELKYVSEADLGNLLVRFVQQRFGEKETVRVVDSFRRTEKGEEFQKVHSSHRLMKQIASSYIDGLTAKPAWPNPEKNYPWASVLQENWQVIRDELEEAIKMGDEGLKERGSISWMGAQGGAESYGTQWKTLGLCDRGYWDEDNSRIFKNTCRVLRKSRAPIMECFFAKMPAQTEIKPHSDYTNFVLTAHLGLKCPEGKCWIDVGDTHHEWKNGGVLLLDTTFLHEASNVAEEDRYVLILRVWHPELTTTEVEAINFIFDALDDSDIILHPDGLAMYDMMKAHRIMEWNAILGPGDTEEECQEIIRKMAEGEMAPAMDEATKLTNMVKEKLNEGSEK